MGFVSVMVDDCKSPSEMVEELTFFKEGAQEFVDLVHKQIGKILARRPCRTAAPALVRRSAGSRGGDLAQIVDKAIESSAIDLDASPSPQKLPLKAADPKSAPCKLREGKQDHSQKKKENLEQMTHMLQVILAKLSGANGQVPSEAEREKYSKMATSLQAKMQAVP